MDNINTFVNEIYSRPPHKNFDKKKTKFKSIDITCSSDLLDMKDYGPKNNRRYR